MWLSSTSYPASTRQIFLGVKLLDFENDHSLPPGTEGRNVWRLTFSPPQTFLSTGTTPCTPHVMRLLMHCVHLNILNYFKCIKYILNII
jgi:hypothetical protein